MPTSVEQLRWERQRKLQVRELFSSGLAYYRDHTGAPLAFYLACADYLVAGQRRLIDQDRRLVEILAPKVPPAQREDHAAMGALRGRLDLADHSLSEFDAALALLRDRGTAGLGDFESASGRFLDVLVNVLGARSHSLRHLTTTLLAEDDWRRIVDITPEFLETEATAFAEISRLAPA